MGVGGLQSKNRFRLRSGRNQKRFLTVSDDARRSVPRVWRARMSRRGRAVKTIDGSRWRGREGNQSIGSEPIGGGDFIHKSLRSLRSQSMESARSRCAGPNRRTGRHTPLCVANQNQNTPTQPLQPLLHPHLVEAPEWHAHVHATIAKFWRPLQLVAEWYASSHPAATLATRLLLLRLCLWACLGGKPN
jgi:hypothetical protein